MYQPSLISSLPASRPDPDPAAERALQINTSTQIHDSNVQDAAAHPSLRQTRVIRTGTRGEHTCRAPGRPRLEQHGGRPGLGNTTSQATTVTPNRPKQVAGGGGVSPGAPRACFRVADTLSESPPAPLRAHRPERASQSLTRGQSRRRVLQEHAESLRHAPSQPHVSPERSAFSSDAGGLSTFAFDPGNLNAANRRPRLFRRFSALTDIPLPSPRPGRAART